MVDSTEKIRITFTGKLGSMTRREAWRVVREIGAEPTSCVSHRTSLVVVGSEGWPLLPDGEISHKLRRAEELKQAGCRIRIAVESEFLSMIGRQPADPAQRKTFPAREVCRVMKIDRGTLRKWDLSGLIQSCHGFYDFQDLVAIQTIRGLVGNGVRLETIARSLQALADILPEMERPLAQLRIIAENQEVLLVNHAGLRFSSSGQLVLNFEGHDRTEGAVLPLDPRAHETAEWLELGLGCEAEGLYPEAADAFRAVLTLEPGCQQAYLHLGNVMREMGILWAAEEFYTMATQLRPGIAEGWISLAGAQEEQGKTDAAIASYRQALAIIPECADGHFNLALCYEKAGRKQDACRHWFAYLKLDPASASAAVARRHVSITPVNRSQKSEARSQ